MPPIFIRGIAKNGVAEGICLALVVSVGDGSGEVAHDTNLGFAINQILALQLQLAAGKVIECDIAVGCLSE